MSSNPPPAPAPAADEDPPARPLGHRQQPVRRRADARLAYQSPARTAPEKSVDGALALQPAEQTRVPSEGGPPGATRTAVIVARALLEVLSGWRPASQLARWTSFALQHDLEQWAPRRPTGTRLQLLRVRISAPCDGVAEVCALAHDTARGRVRVVALRMEHRRGDWVMTRLQAG